MKCSFGTMDWYCVREEGHKGSHISDWLGTPSGVAYEEWKAEVAGERDVLPLDPPFRRAPFDARPVEPRKHVWVSNRAFTQQTGIKQVCLNCGAPSNNAPRVCPGKRPER